MLSSNSAAPDDGVLSNAVQEYLLAQSADDVKNITMKILREALETQFSCELSDRKELLRECLHNFVASITNKEEENGGEGGDGEELLWGEDHDGDADFDDLLGIEGNNDDGEAAEEEEEEAEEEEEEERRSSRKGRAPVNAPRSGAKKGSKGGGGFAGPVQCSNELSEFMGATVVPRTEVTKRIWAYIKEHNLQDPADRRQIVCDAKLEKLFKRKKFGMFKMTKFLSEMMKSTKELQSGKAADDDEDEDGEDDDEDEDGEDDDDDKDAIKTEGSSSSSKKRKTPAKTKVSKSKASSTSSSSSTANKKRKVAENEGGLNKKIPLSDKLSHFLQCTSESRPQVVKKMWDYIKGDYSC